MALKFYWRCESTDLDTGSGDYSAGDTTAQAVGTMPAYNSTAVKVGTNGMYCVASSQRGAGFSLLAAGEIIKNVKADGASAESSIVFSAGWWVNFKTSVGLSPGGNFGGLRLVGDGSNHIEVEGASTTTLRLSIRATSQSDKFAALTTALSADTWYGIVVRVDAAANKFAIELYNASATLIEAVENTSETLGAQMPWFTSASAGLQLGCLASRAAGDTYYDNFIISDAYNAPIAANLGITHSNQYSEAASAAFTFFQYGPRANTHLRM